jgi:hypothetical protein
LGVHLAIVQRLRDRFENIGFNDQSSDVFKSDKYFSHRASELGRNFNVILWES